MFLSYRIRVLIYILSLIGNLYTPELAYLPMTAIAILAILAIRGGIATISLAGFSVISTVVAQTTGDNATTSGNMTGGNVTGSNKTEASGKISHVCKGAC